MILSSGQRVQRLIHGIAAAHTDESFAAVLTAVKSESPDALFAYPNFTVAKHRRALLAFLSANRLPSMFQDSTFAEQGALFSHYANWNTIRRRSAEYVDKILKGVAVPTNMPVEQPEKFDLVVNLKTANALGLTIPQSILGLADEVIE